MLRKAMLVLCILLLIVNLSIFAEQSTEEELRVIDEEIKNNREARTIGIVICLCGVAVMSFFALGAIEAGTESDLPFMLTVGSAAGILSGIGIWIWCDGVRGIRYWEKKKAEVAIQVRGPDLAQGESLGGISLVCSY